MDHVNKTLLLSLKQDLRILDKVVDELSEGQAGSIEVRSWIFPTKQGRFVKQFISDNRIYDSDNVKLYLELILDRIYVGSRYIVNYIKSKIDHDYMNSRSQLIFKPPQITLGCSFENLWKIVQFIIQDMLTKHVTIIENQEGAIHSRSRACQTNIISTNKCDSCASAIMCMKKLMEDFDNLEKDNQLRRKIRPKLYDITQFGCMFQTTRSLELSMNTFSEKISTSTKLNIDLTHENDDLKQKNSQLQSKVSILEEEVRILRKKSSKDAATIIDISNRCADLMHTIAKTEGNSKRLKETISELEIKSRKMSATVIKLTKNNDNLFKFCDSLSGINREIHKKVTSMHSQMKIVDKEINIIQKVFKHFEVTVDGLNRKCTAIAKDCIDTDAKLRSLESGHKEDAHLFEKIREFKGNMNTKMAEICVREAKTQHTTFPKFKIKGNPVEDISTQIEENKQKIKSLQTENDRLQIVVSKFIKIK